MTAPTAPMDLDALTAFVNEHDEPWVSRADIAYKSLPALIVELRAMRAEVERLRLVEEEVVDVRDESVCVRAEAAELRAELVTFKAASTKLIAEAVDRIVDARAEASNYKVLLKQCAINEDNPDTCGVCGAHFHECDDKKYTHEDCLGARIRALLETK